MDPTNACRCCLSQPPDKNILYNTEIETYFEMLKECFEINITMDSVIGDAGICGTCITRLREACNFKRQVQKCQRELQVWLKHQNLAFDDETKSKVEVLDDIGVDNEDDTVLSASKLKKIAEIKDEPNEEAMILTHGLDDDVIVKKRTRARKKCVKAGDIDKRESDLKNHLATESTPRLVYRARNSTMRVSHNKHRHNVENIIKHSNCTVFSNKTINGYVCAYCKDSFRNPLDLRAHTHMRHKNDKLIYEKQPCERNFSVKVDITDLKCKICDTNVATIKDKEHLTKEHGVKFYTELNDYFQEFKLTESDTQKCALCHSTYETFKMLLQHMNDHYRNYVCDVCDTGFVNKHGLTIHKKTHDKGAFKCDHCEKVYDTRTKKMYHEKHIHNASKRARRCPRCDRTFTTYDHRKKHMLEEHNTMTAEYKCNECDKSFLVKAKLTYHIQNVHLMERNHKCSECGKGFFMKHSLEEHMVTHGGERIYKCAVCEKAYARRKTLREHMRIHNNDRRFKCGICAMTFVQKCSMKSHMWSNHGVTLAEFESSLQC